MALADIIVPKENASGDFDEVALAPADIGADSLFDFGSQTLSGTGVTLTASRARIWTLVSFSSTTVTLPSTGVEFGDRLVLRGGSPVSATITITATAVSDTITASGQQISYLYTSTGSGDRWVKNLVDTHTQPASTITGLPEASTTTPAALGTAAVGVGTTFARADHVHAMPTAANVGAAKAVTDIELIPDATTTITTAQLPARGIAFSDGEATFTVNLPTPDIRQSGLTFSIKSQYEGGSGPNFVTVVHAAVNLLTAYELDEDEGSIDFLWDGYAWTYDSAYRLRSFPSRVLQLPSASGTIALTESADNVFRVVGSADPTKKLAFELDTLVDAATTRTLTVPNSSGTIALNETFAAPPSIGNTTANSGSFTTLAANNGTLTASAPVLDLAQTWNASGVTFTGLRLNATDTASAAASNLADFQVGGTSVTAIRKDGSIRFQSGDRTLLSHPNFAVSATAGGAWLGVNTTVSINGGVRSVGGTLALLTAQGTDAVILDRDAANTLAQRNGVNSQEARLYGTFSSSTNYQRMTVKSVKQTLSALSGASATTTGTLIPDGAVVVGVTTRVATLLTGAAGYEVGDGTDADRWGDITGTAVGTTSDNRDWTAGTIECFTAGGNITLTAKTSNFTAGAIEVCAFYLAGEAD